MILKEIVVYAYKKGYRIDNLGNLISPKGKIRKPRVSHNGYYTANIRYNGKVYPLNLHRLCAYQKYGDSLFNAECVRHLDGNALNNRPDNIKIGTQSENMMDIPKEIRQKNTEYATSFVRKYDKNKVREFYKNNGNSYKKTMNQFGITSTGTLWFILNK